jgi:predicted Rossmann fold nucleotide-binding protein DprA/Smf involved in DNA uptake
MDARDRRLLEATARGVRALIRQTTAKYRRMPKDELAELEDVEKKLQNALDFAPNHPQFERQVTEQVEEDTRSVREKALKKIIDSKDEGSTVDEICARFNLPHQSVSARVHELAKAEQIEDSGRRRETRQGKLATVWTWRR